MSPEQQAATHRQLAASYRGMASESDNWRRRFTLLDMADAEELQALAWDTQARKERAA